MNDNTRDIDLLLLAQLYKAKDLLQEQKLHFVKKINVNYIIQDNNHRILHRKSYLGYNCLHIAALKLDWHFTCEFLKNGANIFKQGTLDHKTPLHVALDSIRNCKDRKIWEISGKLQNCPVINTLLSTHVASNNSLNPMCKNGITHLHIASIFNHTEAIEFFLSNGESVEQVTNTETHWPGYTPLHFAVRYSCPEAAQILIDNGADIYVKDARGTTPLQLLIERLLYVNDFLTMGKSTISIPYQEEIKRIEAIVIIFIKAKGFNGMNSLDEAGLTTFHLACTLKDSSIAAEFLKDDIDLNVSVKDNSRFWAGWTPVHFAACLSIDTVKLLVQRGVDITVKNSKGQTPLDLCLKRYPPKVVHSILSARDEFKNILLSDASTTLLDLLLAMNDTDSFNSFLNELENPNIGVSVKSPILPDYGLLHLALSLHERTKSWDDFLKETDIHRNLDNLPRAYNCTEEESDIYSGRIEACLAKGCSLTIPNLDVLTPIHMAFYNHCTPSILMKMLDKCEEDVVDPNNVSLLQIACAVGRLQTVKKLIRARVNINAVAKSSFQWYHESRLCVVNANSTPLHVAVVFLQKDVVECLLDNGANIYAEDSEGFTPIHLSIADSSACKCLVRMIFDKVKVVIDKVTKENLSHLHVAAYANNADAVKKLIMKGAKVHCTVATKVPEFMSRVAGKTPLHVSTHIGGFQVVEVVKVLIGFGANIYDIDLLQCLMSHRDSDFSQHFVTQLKFKVNINEPIDPCGLTLLHVACGKFDADWAGKLLKEGVDPNARIRDDDDYKGYWKGYTPLHVVASRSNFECEFKVCRLVNLLLYYGADVTIGSDDGTALHMAFYWTQLSAVDEWRDNFRFWSEGDDGNGIPVVRTRKVSNMPTKNMLESQKSYEVNPMDSNGISHFHLACMGFVSRHTVEKFLDSGVDINHTTNPFSDRFAGYTALHFIVAAEFSYWMARLLIERGADVNVQDRDGNTPLHVVVSKIMTTKPTLIELFERHGADFNAKNMRGESPVDILLTVKKFTLQQLEYLMANGSLISIRKIGVQPGTMQLIMQNAKSDDRLQIFKLFISICNLKDAAKNDYNFIQDIVRAVSHSLSVADYLDVIQLLLNEGCDVDKQDENGDTPLNTAINLDNISAVKALLQAGTDINNVTRDIFEPAKIEIEELLSIHACKMKKFGLYLSPMSKAICSPFIDRNIVRDIEIELRKAENTKISEYLTARAFLSETIAVVEYSRTRPEQRRDIDEFFKGIGTCLTEVFPQIGGIMILQYNKAVLRPKLIELVKEILTYECHIHLPDLCWECILDYLANDDMKYLIEHSEDTNPRKRQKIG